MLTLIPFCCGKRSHKLIDMLLRCYGGCLVGCFLGFLIAGFVALVLRGVLQLGGMGSGTASALSNSLAILLWFGLIAYFTIKPVLKHRKEQEQSEARRRSEELRIAQENARQQQKQLERERTAEEKKRRDAEDDRKAFEEFLSLINGKSLNDLQTIKRKKLQELDDLKEEREQESHEHYEFVSNPENRGCMDAAMQHHLSVYELIDRKRAQIERQLQKLNTLIS